MQRDEIESKWSLAFCVEQGSCDMLMDKKRLCQDCRDEYFRAKGALALAGLTIIPAVADEQEIERVARNICCPSHKGACPRHEVMLGCWARLEPARAAAAAVREGGKP